MTSTSNGFVNKIKMFSGGAAGADQYWGQRAFENGYDVIHFSFEKHGIKKSIPGTIVKVPFFELEMADPFLRRANKTLHRDGLDDRTEYVKCLLRRNYYQIVSTKSVYAIAGINDKGLVMGGTGWATQMFVDLFEGRPAPCYVFDQEREQWFKWMGSSYEPMIDVPIRPIEDWTGIGTRRLEDVGRRAINSVFE